MTGSLQKLIVPIAAALAGLLVAACSQGASDERSLRLSYVETAPDGVRYYPDGRTPQPASRPAIAPVPGDTARMSFGRVPQPAPSATPPPLRRYAAMPRHKPHAPNVMNDEQSCIAAGYVRKTRFIRRADPVGHGACALESPFIVTAAVSGRVRLSPGATLRCQMIPSLDRWVAEVLQPAARAHLGSQVVGLKVAASYSCRSRNSIPGARLSEHGRGNAIDISEFELADGRRISVKSGWRGPHAAARFLRYVHRGACEHFSTVLGPNADSYHHDHLHLDLALHGRSGTYRVCR